ncbi:MULTISPECIES: hypothetical protein [unclassified Gemella]|uniref:hypothetical protein n=1 Tax=unclassified Gemella TaxID=2624949 RepID=UPI0015D045CF|nr:MULTISPECIES: hypothetical protein [unclassified Gemella]MBF0710506.1 hypothetical protein [Gemella sp. GL1.1]NYS27850.1 hypothetical protein [Gemella sp. GL1]
MKNSKKVLITLSVLATPVLASILEENIASANTYTVNQNVKTYTNAANAAKAVNAKSSYGQGTYHIYKQANGMINISKTAGKAGAWINPNENKVVATKVQTNQSTNPKAVTTKVQTSQSTQSKIAAAKVQTNQTTQSKVATKAQTNQTTQSKTATKTQTSQISNQHYVLNTSVRTYSNASSAATGTNARSVYSKGNYYVYKTANDMINISRVQGKAGAWINPTDNKFSSSNTVAKTKQTAIKPAIVKKEETKNMPTKSIEASRKYTLETDVNTYTNAGLAASKVSAKSKYTKGSYFIYKTANGMINISKTAGKAGAWINPTENKVIQAKIASSAKKESTKQLVQANRTTSKQTTAKKEESKKTVSTTQIASKKEVPKFDSNGLLVRQRSAKGQQVINHLLSIPGHRNGAAYHASSGVDKLIDELTTAEALWVIHRIEGAGFGQTGDGYAGIDTAKSHQIFVNNQLNRRFGGSVHSLLKKWGTYTYGGY